MIEGLIIRPFVDADVEPLRRVFYTSVHQNACNMYSEEQCHAWAPSVYDRALWRQRMIELQPYVACVHDIIVGYGDLQPNGFLDHFYVAGGWNRRGIGTSLLRFIHSQAQAKQIAETFSHVSLAAQALFLAQGYRIDSTHSVVVRGVSFESARMSRSVETS